MALTAAGRVIRREFLLKPTLGNALMLGLSEALSQWTNPELVVGGLSTGILGLQGAKSVIKIEIKTANGSKITGFTSDGLNRTIGDFSRKGVKSNDILDALKNPLKINNITTDHLGRQSQRYIGQWGEVVINQQTGKIISVNPTSSSKVVKLFKQHRQ